MALGTAMVPFPPAVPVTARGTLPWHQFSSYMSHGDADEAAAGSTQERRHKEGAPAGWTPPKEKWGCSYKGSQKPGWEMATPPPRQGCGTQCPRAGSFSALLAGHTQGALWCPRGAGSIARAGWDGDKGCCDIPLASASRFGIGRDRLNSPRFTLQTPPVTLCRDMPAAGCCQRAAAASVQAGLWPQELTQPSPLTLLRQLPVPFSCLSCDRMLSMQVPGP